MPSRTLTAIAAGLAVEVIGGPRAVRRAIRRGADVEVAIGPRTRIVVDDEETGHERVTADDPGDTGDFDPGAPDDDPGSGT